MAEYWVYKNRPTSAATVHVASCPYVSDRQPTPNGYWLGPFSTDDEAIRTARGTGVLRPTLCDCTRRR